MLDGSLPSEPTFQSKYALNDDSRNALATVIYFSIGCPFNMPRLVEIRRYDCSFKPNSRMRKLRSSLEIRRKLERMEPIMKMKIVDVVFDTHRRCMNHTMTSVVIWENNEKCMGFRALKYVTRCIRGVY